MCVLSHFWSAINPSSPDILSDIFPLLVLGCFALGFSDADNAAFSLRLNAKHLNNDNDNAPANTQSRFEEWTGWCLLVVLALYDLCAVLTPCGPLKALVNLMQVGAIFSCCLASFSATRRWCVTVGDMTQETTPHGQVCKAR